MCFPANDIHYTAYEVNNIKQGQALISNLLYAINTTFLEQRKFLNTYTVARLLDYKFYYSAYNQFAEIQKITPK